MVTITNPTTRKPGVVNRETEDDPAAVLAPEQAGTIGQHDELPHVIVELAPALDPQHEESRVSRMARGILSFYDSLSGPAMSERDRMNREMAEARSGSRLYPF